jgi:hypothetical protein
MNTNQKVEIPTIDWGLTPITDDTFDRMGWTKINVNDDENVFYQFDEVDGDDIEFTESLSDEDEDFDEQDTDDAYYWVLKLPRDNEIEYENGCPVLLSSLSNESINGLKKGQYFVQIHDFFDLGICFSEEEIEILYRSMCNKDIYDF